VSGGLTFKGVSAGGDIACGVTQGNATYCWGSNGSGQPKQISTYVQGRSAEIDASAALLD
jgi:hypothetical protein